jgi:RNA polymerase sigma-70 factor (ECF subfamily)
MYTNDAAEEVVCEVLASVWRNRASLVVQSTVAAYLHGAVRHRALNVLRAERREARWTETFLRDETPPAHGTAVPAPDANIELAEQRAALERALADLPDRARLVLVLRWERGMSIAHIAEALGTSVGAAQMQVSRALAVLRTRLAAYLD